MPGLTPACELVRQSQEWFVLFFPDLAPTCYHVFVLVKNALRGHHFADNNELEQDFVMCSEFEAGNSETLVYSVLLNVEKGTLKL
jgi:hypothetical protein